MSRPTRASYSALSTFENCPLSYKLYYIDHHSTPVGPAAKRGSRLHTAMEKFLKGELDKLPIEFYHIEDEIKMMKAAGAVAEEKWWAAEGFAPQDSEDESTRFVGITDIHYPIDTTLIVRDLKSGRKYPEHEDQLEIYGILGLQRFPDMERAEVSCLYLEEPSTPAVIPRALLPHLVDRWSERLEKLWVETKWEPTPGPDACRWCGYVKMGLCDSPWGRK